MHSGGSDDKAASKNSNAVASAVFGLLVIGGIGWYFFGGGLERHAAQSLNGIEDQVAVDSVQKYQIAKRNGDPMDICVQAQLVVASYLQAKDEANYQQWKQTEKTDCAAAGLPQ